MKVIVLADSTDNHTAPIRWALEEAGYQVACWPGVSWKEEQQTSLLLGSEPRVMLGPHSVEPGDVIWNRRPKLPVENPHVAEPDRKFTEKEYRSFYHCVVYLLEELPVWCVNKFSASRVINNKSVQLLLARRCGLRTPATLMSNSPRSVRDFLALPGRRAIFKAFTPHVWHRETEGGVAVTETFELKPEQLPADEVLTFAPGIYQEMVIKEFDVRMVLMGNHLYSYALYNPLNRIDWRQDAALNKIQVEAIATPEEVKNAVQAFARAAGICFGSLDLAVDADGRWWFLEINEQGQFLWLDQFNRSLRLQEKFCAFITAPQGSMVPPEEREGLFPPLAEYEKQKQMKPQESLDVAAAVAASPNFSREP